MKRIYLILMAFILLALASGIGFFMMAKAEASAADSNTLLIKQQGTFEIPVLDGPHIIGRMEIQANVLFSSISDHERSDIVWREVQEAQIMALQDYVNIKVDPRLPVNGEAIAQVIERALEEKGFPKSRALIQHIQVKIV